MLLLNVQRLLKESGVKYAPQGAVYEMRSEGLPYKAIFHTVPCDGFYDTSAEIIKNVIRECLRQCIELGGISSIALSVLGCGYGKMAPEEFFRIASRVS